MTDGAGAKGTRPLLVVSAFVASAILVVPSMVEPFMLPKVTAIVVVAVILAAWCGFDAVTQRRVAVPRSWLSVAVGVFALALVIATATSSDRATSVFGWYGRYTGLVPYLAYLVLFVVVMTSGSLFHQLLRRSALVLLGLVVGYGLLQALGADPVSWLDNGLGTEFSTLGNVDFAAAWAGSVLALAAATSLSADETRLWRLYAAIIMPLTGIYLVATGTSQGVVVAFVALLWVALVMGLRSDGSAARFVRTHRPAAYGFLLVAVVACLGAALMALPFLRAQLDQAFVERPEFWATAISIFRDHPLTGTGLDTFGNHFLAYRPASHAIANTTAGADAPHSVLLGMFSNGGIILGVSYMVVVALVGWALVRGVLRSSDRERVVLAGFGGVWLGYQAQSLVSYDVPSLALLHWLSAGVIVAVAARPEWHVTQLPGAAPARGRTTRGKSYGPTVTPASTRVLQVTIAGFAVIAVWFAAYPLRADLLAASAAPLGRTGQLGAAIDRLERAGDMNPAEAYYPYLAARAQNAAGRPRDAFAAAAEAARRDRGGVQYALFAAQAAASAGDPEAAMRWYKESAERDPNDPAVLAAVGQFYVSQGRLDEAAHYLKNALALDPDNPVALQQMDLVSQARAAG